MRLLKSTNAINMFLYVIVMDHINKFSATQQRENAGASMAMEKKSKKPEKLESQFVILKVRHSYLDISEHFFHC